MSDSLARFSKAEELQPDLVQSDIGLPSLNATLIFAAASPLGLIPDDVSHTAIFYSFSFPDEILSFVTQLTAAQFGKMYHHFVG